MPHPHEQKLHDVVNSATFASLSCSVAAATAGMSTMPESARPTPPPTVTFSQSRRLTEVGSLTGELRTSMGFSANVRHRTSGHRGPQLCVLTDDLRHVVVPTCRRVSLNDDGRAGDGNQQQVTGVIDRQLAAGGAGG